MSLPGLAVGIFLGLFVTIPMGWQASAPAELKSGLALSDIARLSPPELETLAVNVLTELHEKQGPVASRRLDAGRSLWDQTENNLRQVYQGIRNVRRLLPLAKKLTLESLGGTLKTASLSREKRLIAAVRQVVLDPRQGNSASVWEEDLSIIHVGPDYAVHLTSDDEVMLLLGHELTHVAVRTGRLNDFIENVNEGARSTASLELAEEQKEELACDFIGAEVLKRYIALNPTEEASARRFSRAFGYEPPSERLAHAWQDFCASYNGDSQDSEHLSQDQTLRALPGLDPELKALIPDDADSIRLCR